MTKLKKTRKLICLGFIVGLLIPGGNTIHAESQVISEVRRGLLYMEAERIKKE